MAFYFVLAKGLLCKTKKKQCEDDGMDGWLFQRKQVTKQKLNGMVKGPHPLKGSLATLLFYEPVYDY